MTKENYYEGIKQVVYISTDCGTTCEHCSASIGIEKFVESINHYIEQHGYRLLHVGTETSNDINDGTPWHSSVAVLGIEKNLPKYEHSRSQIIKTVVSIANPPPNINKEKDEK